MISSSFFGNFGKILSFETNVQIFSTIISQIYLKYGNIESPNDCESQCDIDETRSECESHPDQACGEPISHEVNLLIIVPITKLYCVVVIR